MTNDPVGSTWKKWDLHVHTPSSLVHNYPGASQDEAWEAFLTDLEALPPEFKAIGINDYIFIDGYERARKATFNYVSGGIESPLIEATVVEILEGTEPAFRNQKRKYGL